MLCDEMKKYQAGQYIALKVTRDSDVLYLKIVSMMDSYHAYLEGKDRKYPLLDLRYFKIEILDIDEMQFKLLLL
jgi:hypothetical protein